MTTITDTDKGGLGFQRIKTYLGPSLGWIEEYVQPSTKVTTPGTYVVAPGDGIILVDVAGPITIQLPDVRLWVQQPAYQPATAWNRQLIIKDWGGHADTFPITIAAFLGQVIDKTAGSASIHNNNNVIELVPTIDLSGWIISAGADDGIFLPVNNPVVNGKLTVGTLGGDVAAIFGGAAGSQSVSYIADPSSVDAIVNIHIMPKGSGGVLMYSNDALQVAVSGSAGNNKFISLTGGSPGLNPSISSSFGGPIDVRDAVRVGPLGGNRGLVSGSAAGQQAIIYGVDAASPDADVNVHLIPKNDGGTLLYSHGSLQMQVSGPANTTDYLVVSGAIGLDDPLIANASGGPIRLQSEILVGPAGGNFAGLQGSAAGQQNVAVRADNIINPDANINIALIPKGINGGCQFWASNTLQVIVNGPAGASRFVNLSGSVAGNPIIQAAFTTDIDILNANLTGVPRAPTAAPGTSTTQVATTAFVQAAGAGAFLPLTGGTLTGPLTVAATLNAGNIFGTDLEIGGVPLPSIQLTPSAGATTNTFLYQNQNNFTIGNSTVDVVRINHTTGDWSLLQGPLRVLNTSAGIGETNYERFTIDWSTNVGTCTVGPQNGGTGTARKTWAIGQWTFPSKVPQTKTADFTVAQTDCYIICNKTSAMIVTLPAAASHPGREITLKNVQAFTVASASANIVPRNGGAAAAPILPATIGAWVLLVSDGVNWVIMQAA